MDLQAINNVVSGLAIVSGIAAIAVFMIAPEVVKWGYNKIISLFDIDGLKANFKKYQAKEERRIYWREFYKNNPDKDKYRRNKR